jgi:transposase
LGKDKRGLDIMTTDRLDLLRALYGEFRHRIPPNGFSAVSEDLPVLIDLLDGDISGLTQQFLAGTDISKEHGDWLKRAETVQSQLEECCKKLSELDNHFKLLTAVSDKIIEIQNAAIKN